MANVIIGFHGLGNKPPKPLLEQWWRLAMIEGLKSNNFKCHLPEFELVYWADIIYDKPLSESVHDEESPYFIDEKYTIAPADFPVEDHKTRQKVVDFLSKQLNRIFLNDDLTLNHSVVADAIVSKYFKDLEIYYSENCISENNEKCLAKDLIRDRLLKKLEKYKKNNIMLISHSMGSIIAFDVLTFIAPKIRINTFITMGSPLGLPIVVSKIASEQKQKHVETNQINTPDGIIKNWFNFSDILDKVALNYKLSENFSENTNGIKPVDFLVVNNYEMSGTRNPHKSFGYLRTPEFSKVLNDFIRTERLTIKERITSGIKAVINKAKTKISAYKEKIKRYSSNS
ncbi:MAG TPA: hypothetical protein VMV77_05440 [Bacteroidales bacterium]|nr:hypothetical protein [Bacteroidales bacterium]